MHSRSLWRVREIFMQNKNTSHHFMITTLTCLRKWHKLGDLLNWHLILFTRSRFPMNTCPHMFKVESFPTYVHVIWLLSDIFLFQTSQSRAVEGARLSTTLQIHLTHIMSTSVTYIAEGRHVTDCRGYTSSVTQTGDSIYLSHTDVLYKISVTCCRGDIVYTCRRLT